MVTPELNGRPGVRPLTAPPGSGGPTVLRILLGAQLRRLREAKRITLEDAGQVIRASGSKMSRLETGRVGFKDRDISDLLTLYGVTDTEQRDAIRALARDASAQGWWHDYSDILPSWFEAYIGLEEATTGIRAYEIQFVPGLLQTEGYARALIRQGSAASCTGCGSHAGSPRSRPPRRSAARTPRSAGWNAAGSASRTVMWPPS